MATKKPQYPTYNEAVYFNFKEILKVVDLEDITFVEKLEGEKRREFMKFCHDTYHNPFFLQIITNFIHTQVMFTADDAITGEQYWGGKMMCQGVITVEEFFRKYAVQFDQEFRSDSEKFDPRASFSKAKV